jgi:hypothetical protein
MPVEVPESRSFPDTPSRSTAVEAEFPPHSDAPAAVVATAPALPEGGVGQVREAESVLDPSLEPKPEPSSATPPAALAEPQEDVGENSETPEQSTQAARDAGLMAVRGLSDTPAFNRWAAGTLADDGLGGFTGENVRPQWPFVLMSLLLLMLLLVQAAHHFRGELVRKWPDAEAWYASLGVAVPLPRDADLVAIESSDLQSDVRGCCAAGNLEESRCPSPGLAFAGVDADRYPRRYPYCRILSRPITCRRKWNRIFRCRGRTWLASMAGVVRGGCRRLPTLRFLSLIFEIPSCAR